LLNAQQAGLLHLGSYYGGSTTGGTTAGLGGGSIGSCGLLGPDAAVPPLQPARRSMELQQQQQGVGGRRRSCEVGGQQQRRGSLDLEPARRSMELQQMGGSGSGSFGSGDAIGPFCNGSGSSGPPPSQLRCSPRSAYLRSGLYAMPGSQVSLESVCLLRVCVAPDCAGCCSGAGLLLLHLTYKPCVFFAVLSRPVPCLQLVPILDNEEEPEEAAAAAAAAAQPTPHSQQQQQQQEPAPANSSSSHCNGHAANSGVPASAAAADDSGSALPRLAAAGPGAAVALHMPALANGAAACNNSSSSVQQQPEVDIEQGRATC
jgi:hypothetical protein